MMAINGDMSMIRSIDGKVQQPVIVELDFPATTTTTWYLILVFRIDDYNNDDDGGSQVVIDYVPYF